MEVIGLFEAKTHLSEYVARAEAGEEVVITRHNKPVAKIVPLTAEPPAKQDVVPFVQRTYNTGVPLVDWTRANQLADALEDEELIEKMRRIEGAHRDRHAAP
jgi:prevent-host-death family protein